MHPFLEVYMIIRTRCRVNGIVQGVGFRPFIHKQINAYKLNGWIRNTSVGAEIELEGEKENIDRFTSDLWTKAPRLALIASVQTESFDDLVGYKDFKIIKSEGGAVKNTLISPDVCICDECAAELFTQGKRYRYPFINCTNCGPRFTIIKDVPYDRDKTTMAPFKMCDTCYSQYTFIEDRRYHAEPTGCNLCGPKERFLNSEGKLIASEKLGNKSPEDNIEDDPIEVAKRFLREGKIVAIKGLGGYHLACRFDDSLIPNKLRARKHRDEKPFAIMCKDVETARRYANISSSEEKILTDQRRSIVLLKKNKDVDLSAISENGYVGIMLPYTPVHLMLFTDDIDALVMTSANISDLPIIYKDDKAVIELSGIADGFLVSEREIHVRCDDSLCYVYDDKVYPVRRSRGFVPYPIIMSENVHSILACGAEQKASFCLSKGNYIFPSQHIGDMKNIETFENYCQQIEHFKNLFDIKPKLICCDLHPDYLSTNYAKENSNGNLLMIQHHHAHMASCMADNNLDGKVIGVIWDGVGYGEDGNSWGGEFLVGGYDSFKRAGHIRYMKLPGGDAATKKIYKVGISLLVDAGISPDKIFDSEITSDVLSQLKANINCPLSSGIGRLFDGVSSIIGIKQNASYEGQGAILLEAAATFSQKFYNYDIISKPDSYEIDYRPMIREIANDVINKVSTGIIAAAFMNTLLEIISEMCEKIYNKTGLDRVVFSGGTFNNMYMMNMLPKIMRDKGLKMYHHHRVSTGDEGLSLGQLMIANSYLNKKG